jgi:DNA-binding MarR family transcriptional regulator
VDEQVDWLSDEEREAWRALVMLTQLLPGAIDRQLQAEAGVAHADYAVIATLSDAPSRRMRMSDLASIMDYSQSRLSHAMNRIERLDWARREPCPSDKRVCYAVLTDRGHAILTQVAPGHVSHVRRLVFDHLTTTQVRQLCRIADAILPQIAGGVCPSEQTRSAQK